MIGRRGFFKFMGLAPLAGSMAANEAVSQISAGNAIAADPCVPEPPCRANERLHRKINEFNISREMYVDPDPKIEGMKSWSAVFKHSEQRKDLVRRRKLSSQIDEIMYSDMSVLEKTVRLTALGIKI